VIGEVQDGIFVPQDHIKQVLGVDFQTAPSPRQSNNNLTYQSQNGVKLEVKVSGATSAAFQHIGKAQAGISVTFGSEGACVFSVPHYRVQRAANQITFKRELLERIDENWNRNYAVVSEVILAESATILVAQDSQAHVEISAKADVHNPLADIGNAALGLQGLTTKSSTLSKT
jgi:hypothetical protein